MSQRNTSPLKRSTVRRTLQRFWDVTRTQPLIVFLSVFSSAGYIFLLTFANTYVMALIVDRVQAGPVAGDQVFEVFGPYILALVFVNLVGQILSKLQDYTVYKLEIAGNYHLARLCFDTLSNQSMTFHTSRFGGSLVSQTSRFMSGYTGLVDVTVYSLIPTITSVVCTVAALAPVVPTFTVILVGIMVVYIAFVWLMYKRIMPLSAATSAAQNKLSGVLSDAVTNILAVKTCGREDFERDLFDAADRAARDAETVSMHAMMQRNFTTSGLIVVTMAVVSVFVAGRQRVVWHLCRRARHDLYLYVQPHHASELRELHDAAHQPRAGRCGRDDARAGRAASGGRRRECPRAQGGRGCD